MLVSDAVAPVNHFAKSAFQVDEDVTSLVVYCHTRFPMNSMSEI